MISLHWESQPFISILQPCVCLHGRLFPLISWLLSFTESFKGRASPKSFLDPSAASANWISSVPLFIDAFRKLWHNIKAQLIFPQTSHLPTGFSTSVWVPAGPSSQYVGHTGKSNADFSTGGMSSSSPLIKKGLWHRALYEPLSDKWKCKHNFFFIFPVMALPYLLSKGKLLRNSLLKERLTTFTITKKAKLEFPLCK